MPRLPVLGTGLAPLLQWLLVPPGRVLGVRLSVDTVITERVVPVRKIWKTLGASRLLIIGAYRMGFELASEADGSLLRVFIDFTGPRSSIGGVLVRLLGARYARWCVERMLADAQRAFSGGHRAGRRSRG